MGKFFRKSKVDLFEQSIKNPEIATEIMNPK